MRAYVSLTVFSLFLRVSAWNKCYCTGSDKAVADTTANTCCTDGDGVSFPHTTGDVKGRWDSSNKICVFSGQVLSQNSENDATAAFAACCRPTGGSTIWGGACS
ncbi:uncharacterized protein BKA55DRAFT_741231 [Fusarium redolens]|uniref:Uncharacterized protein n=1 Tax=Fusarium redolens TaxID=48865 RepID=A0A9P9GIL1_FUSRE|nr:uncharacterized protein BKA55DRAFT_741231 [Fusarium redolens]KAH7240199.1 hypothetical protein BKA55DRAFT_741231 [Fusarium redolens]